MSSFNPTTIPGHGIVQTLATEAGVAWDSPEFAKLMDDKDTLKSMRNEFHFPPQPSCNGGPAHILVWKLFRTST